MFHDTVVRAGGLLAGVVDGLDPDAVSGSAARELWSAFDRAERLCAAGKTLLARRLAATHQRSGGTRSAVEELARTGGTSAGQAKDAVDTSHRLSEQPAVDDALRRGQLSPPQAAAVSAAAAVNPAEEARLVALAPRVSLPELREECARVKATADPDPEATYRRLHSQRRLRRWIDSEGFWNLHAKGTPQDGAAFTAAADPVIDALFNQARRAGRREPVEAYGFDALIHMADHVAGRCSCRTAPAAAGEPQYGDVTQTTGQSAAAGEGVAEATARQSSSPARATDESTGRAQAANESAGPAQAGDGSAGPTQAAHESAGPSTAVLGRAVSDDVPVTPSGTGEPGIFAAAGLRPQPGPVCGVRPARSVNPRYLALLRVDVEALRRGQVAGEELCEITGVGPIPVTVARDLLGEAIVKLVITDGVDVLNVTHLGRGPTAAQRAALMWMNPTCSVQGCNRRRIEWDHREPWAATRHTRLDELDPLCAFHHDLKTRLGWALVPGTGKRAFVPPDDPRHPNNQRAGTDQPPGTGQSKRTGRTAGRNRAPGEAFVPKPPRERSSRAPTGAGRPSTARPSAAPPGKAVLPRTARQAAAAQLTLPPPAPGEQAPQPP